MIHLDKFLKVGTIQVHEYRYNTDTQCRYNLGTYIMDVGTYANVGTMKVQKKFILNYQKNTLTLGYKC